MNVTMPTFDKMMLPTIQALQKLGGSGTVDEIYEQVVELLSLPNEVLETLHGATAQSEVEYRLAWSRTYLKKFGLINNSGSTRGVWSLTSADISINDFDAKEVLKVVRSKNKALNAQNGLAGSTSLTPSIETSEAVTAQDSMALSTSVAEADEDETEMAWHLQLHQTLMKLSPDAFERLTQRLLRESGFTQVEVTGKSGDGGIDGKGIAQVAGFLSFYVLFQSKRYQAAITSSQIRDFRGAMQGRTDKGLFITTSTFTRDAIKEATRDGAPPVDLINGEQLVQRLKELRLGVTVELVEKVEVDTGWFEKI
jgi:restriction system protein